MRNALEALVEVPSNVAVLPAKRPAACLGVVHALRKLVLGVPSAIPKVRAAFDEPPRALDGIDVGQLGPNGRRDAVAELVQRPPDPCEFKFGNWQTLPPNRGERMRALGAQCNRNGLGHFPESAEGVGQLHLSRRPALRLEQPGTGDEYGRASPNVAQPSSHWLRRTHETCCRQQLGDNAGKPASLPGAMMEMPTR